MSMMKRSYSFSVLLFLLSMHQMDLHGIVKQQEINNIMIMVSDFVDSASPVLKIDNKELTAQQLLGYPYMVQPLSITIHNKMDKPVAISSFSLGGVRMADADKIASIMAIFTGQSSVPFVLLFYLMTSSLIFYAETVRNRLRPILTTLWTAWGLYDTYQELQLHKAVEQLKTLIQSLLMPINNDLIIIAPGERIRRIALIDSGSYWGVCHITIFDESGMRSVAQATIDFNKQEHDAARVS